MLPSPALVTLPFDWAAGFNVVVVLTDLTGALELTQGLGGRFGLGRGAPTVVRSLGGN
jgi:hypothetical protein